MKNFLFISVLALFLSASGALAQSNAPVGTTLRPVFGSIFGADDSTIIVRTDDGKYVTMIIKDPVTITLAQAASLAQVKSGSVIATGTATDNSGNITSQEIFVAPTFAPANGGMSPVWFDQPVTTVDSGTVQNVSAAAGGSQVTLSESSGTKSVALSSNASVKVLSYTDISALQRDSRVRALASLDGSGTLEAALVEIDGR